LQRRFRNEDEFTVLEERRIPQAEVFGWKRRNAKEPWETMAGEKKRNFEDLF